MLADQILHRIEWVHSKAIVYNNIEPGNLVAGLGEKQDKIFLIDFGHCQKFVDEEGNHFCYQDDKEQLGSNASFKSINSHIGKSNSESR